MASLVQLLASLGPAWATRERISVGGETVEVEERGLYSIAKMIDAKRDRLRAAVKARFPGGGAPDDALGYIGRDRQILRGLEESSEAYAERLVRFLDDWRLAGTAWAMLEQLRAFLTPHQVRLRLYNNHGTCRTIDRDGTRSRVVGTNWDWDGTPSAWSRFWVLIYMTDSSPRLPWDRCNPWGEPGDTWGMPNKTWGSTARPNEVAGVLQIVRTWKHAGSRCPFVLIVFDDAALAPGLTAPPLPDGTWGNWSKNVAGVQVPARSADAIYWRP